MTLPYYRPKFRDWAWDFLPSADGIKLLENLPGLRFDFDNQRLYGTVDALSAARIRLSESPIVTVPGGNWIDWKGVLLNKLRDYQRVGVFGITSRLQAHGGAILADDMGLGKTVQALAVAEAVGGRVFIVCPASVRETWRDEIRKWLGQEALVLDPQARKAEREVWEAGKATAQFIVTSYELAQRAHDECFVNSEPGLVIADEAHMLKGRKAARAQTLESITVMCNARLALTGTPIWSRPRDFYRLLKILTGTKAWGSPSAFDFAYCGGQPGVYGGVDNRGLSRPEELKHRLSYYMVRRERQEVIKELPALSHQVRWVDADAVASRMWERAQVMRTGLDAALQATLAGKVNAAVEACIDAGRFFCVTWLKEHARLLTRLINQDGGQAFCITGDLPHVKRSEIIAECVAKRGGIVATMDSVSTGLNLQAVASIGIMHALDWVPAKMAQTIMRIYRPACQTEAVQWVYLAMKDSADTAVVNTVINKMEQWKALMGGSSQRGMRDALGAEEWVTNEKEVLRRLYEEM